MRKYIRKYWGGGTTPSYTVPYNSGSSMYQNIMGVNYADQLQDSFNQIQAPTNAAMTVGSKLGDPLSMLLKGTIDTNKTMGKMKNLTDATKVKSGIFSKAKIGNTMNIAGQAADMIGSFIPKKEQSALTTGLNSGYDAASDAVSMIPGVGTVIGGAMKIGGMLSDGLTAMGVGTDQMTTTDKLLDSKFLKLTPMGLINSFGAKKAATITKDNEAFEQVGSSYGGTSAKVDDALTKSGKKYGLLSSKGRNAANNQIYKAQNEQIAMSNIADKAQLANIGSNNPFLGMATQNQLMGGYQQAGTRLGKIGLKIDKELTHRVVKLAKGKKGKVKEEVTEFQKGGTVDGVTGAAPKVTFESWYRTIPEDRNDTTSYNLRRAFELAPKDELEAWRTSSISDLKSGKNHLNSVYLNPKTNVYEFMKSKNHPTLKYELDWYNSNDPEAIQFRNSYDLDKSGEYYRYVPKKFKDGGSIEQEFMEAFGIEIFKDGGSVNVIPDGALHAHKHHLENVDDKFEDVTSKGIPVITEDKGGDITQHAEVERDEIIFNLEVTMELEKLMKDGSDDAAIEAGKLLVKEILENTVDNTGLLDKVE